MEYGEQIEILEVEKCNESKGKHGEKHCQENWLSKRSKIKYWEKGWENAIFKHQGGQGNEHDSQEL